MWDYIKNAFTTPLAERTFVHDLVIMIVILVLLAAVIVICVGIGWLIALCADKKRNKCENRKLDGFGSHNCTAGRCIFCRNYKKHKKDKSDE